MVAESADEIIEVPERDTLSDATAGGLEEGALSMPDAN